MLDSMTREEQNETYRDLSADEVYQTYQNAQTRLLKLQRQIRELQVEADDAQNEVNATLADLLTRSGKEAELSG